VRSLPTVKFFLHGKVVNEFMGAQPESQIRRLLEQHIVRESDRLVSQALNLLQQGAQEDAQKLLEQANNIEPGRANIVAALAAILLGKNELQRASELIQTLSHEDRHSAEIAGLAAQIEFLLEAVNLPDTDTLSANIESNPDDLESRHQLATVLAAQEKFEAAMQQWLEVMRRDRGFREDIGRKSLLKLFDRLGDDPLAAAYRRKMFNLLY
jgi:putative thioredoxin